MRGQAQVLDGAARAASRRQHVLLVEQSALDLGSIQISLMHVGLLEAVVSLKNDRVEQIGKDGIALFIASHDAHGLDERVAWVVYPCLDSLIKGKTRRGYLAT